MRRAVVRAYLAGLALMLASGWARADTAPPSSIAIPNGPARAAAEQAEKAPPITPPRGSRLVIDHSGRRQTGKVSIYAHSFDGRRMADGNRFNPNDHVAASKGLPLGTTAVVTNLDTGRSSTVRVEDHGPYVDGRVLDVSPKVASEIGLPTKQGVAPVIVAPVAVPQPDGEVKPGAGAVENSR